MATRIYSKQVVTPAQRSRMERNRHAALQRRAAVIESRRIPMGLGVPGLTRTSLAYVRSMPGSGETKFNDTTFSQATTAAGANVTFNGAVNGVSLCLIPQGTTQNTRIGNKVNLMNIRIKGYLSLTPNTITGERVRIILYKDLQANGAAPAVTDILEAGNVDSFINMDNTERFKIIKDRIFDLNPGSGSAASNCLIAYKTIKMNHKARCRIDYSATTGAITELRSANFGVLVLDTVGGGATFAGRARVTFVE